MKNPEEFEPGAGLEATEEKILARRKEKNGKKRVKKKLKKRANHAI